jgi:parallel beta-helix repeat protein
MHDSFSKFAKWTLVLISGLILFCSLPAAVRAQAIINVPADQATIQAAINAANNGDTVLVAPGTYIENINFGGKTITVTSSGGPSATIIDGNANGSVVTFNTGETTDSILSGFTIRNGLRAGLWGAGILVVSASPTITGNVITGNHAAVGIGITVNGGSPIIRNNTITANDQTGAGDGGQGGGGILVWGNSSTIAAPQIVGNTITQNSVATGGGGGGISIIYSSSPLIQGNLIQGNTAYNGGGGISVQSNNSATIVQNIIVNNSVLGGGSGGGLWIFLSGSTETFINNTIAGNTAFDNTSGIYVTGLGQEATFTNNIIVAANGQNAVTCNATYSAVSPIFSHNDAFSISGPPWSGICDSTTNPGNISSDPLFVNAAGGDFHLQSNSPDIDAGDNSASNLPKVDYDGNTRVLDGNNDCVSTVDMGVYELVLKVSAGISPSSLPFSSQVIGTTSSPQTATVTSTGTGCFQFAGTQITGDFAQGSNCPTLGVPGGTSCAYSIAFTPAASGPRTGILTVNGSNGTSLLVSLSGTGLTPAAVSLSPASLTFPSQQVGTTSAAQTVTLTNTGGGSLSITNIGASQQFSQTNNCSLSLAGGSSCAINVSFTPTTGGAISGTLTITDSAAGSPQTVSLSGTGVLPHPRPISLVQHASKDAGTNTVASQAFKVANTAGNWIAVCVRAGKASEVIKVRDSRGNFYRLASQLNITIDTPNGDSLAVFYAENIAGGTNTVTVSDTASATLAFLIFEYSGVATSNSLDITTSAQGTSAAPNSGTATTSVSGDLLLGAIATANGALFTAGSGFVIEDRVPAESSTRLIAEDQVQPIEGAASATTSLGKSDHWGAILVAFKAALQ